SPKSQQAERGINMSHDNLSDFHADFHGSDCYDHVDLLPAELEAIDERVAIDAILWERRLASTDRLETYIRSLPRGLVMAAGDDRSSDVLGEDGAQARCREGPPS